MTIVEIANPFWVGVWFTLGSLSVGIIVLFVVGILRLLSGAFE